MTGKDFRKKVDATRARGLAPPELIRHARPGAVFTAKDAAIRFPDGELPDAKRRTMHVRRWVIVVQAEPICRTAVPLTVLVVPCSSSWQGGPEDYDVPEDEPAFKERTTAYTSLVQPILKAALLSHVDDLRMETLTEVQRQILRNFGLIGQGRIEVPAVESTRVPNARDPVSPGPTEDDSASAPTASGSPAPTAAHLRRVPNPDE